MEQIKIFKQYSIDKKFSEVTRNALLSLESPLGNIIREDQIDSITNRVYNDFKISKIKLSNNLTDSEGNVDLGVDVEKCLVQVFGWQIYQDGADINRSQNYDKVAYRYYFSIEGDKDIVEYSPKGITLMPVDVEQTKKGFYVYSISSWSTLELDIPKDIMNKSIDELKLKSRTIANLADQLNKEIEEYNLILIEQIGDYAEKIYNEALKNLKEQEDIKKRLKGNFQ
jgi:hypothetical protein